MTDRALRLLLAFYPKAWRRRYGEELAQLLADINAEEPGSTFRNVLDVARNIFPVHATWRPVLPSLVVFFVGGSLATIAITSQQAQQTAGTVQAGSGQVLIIQSRHKSYVSRDFTKHGKGSAQVLTVKARPLGSKNKLTFVCRETDCKRAPGH